MKETKRRGGEWARKGGVEKSRESRGGGVGGRGKGEGPSERRKENTEKDSGVSQETGETEEDEKEWTQGC